MSYKRFIYLIFFSLLVIYILVEFHYYNFKHYRHELDIRTEKLDNTENKQFESVVLSDSVTRFAFWNNDKIDKKHLDMTNSAAIGMAGNYFILKRFFSNENTTKKVYIFVSPLLLQINLQNRWTYSHFSSVFDRYNEQEEMKKIGRSDLYGQRHFFNDRVRSIKKRIGLESEVKRIKEFALYIENEEHRGLDKINSDRNKKGIIDQSKTKFELSEISKHFLEKTQDLLKEKKVELVYCIAPIPYKKYQAFVGSNMYSEFMEIIRGYEIIDINAIYQFPDQAFYDSIHLKKMWNSKYAYIIQNNINKFFDLTHYPIKKNINNIDEYISLEDAYVYRGKVDPIIKNGYITDYYVVIEVESRIDADYMLKTDVYAPDKLRNSLWIKVNEEKKKVFHITEVEKPRLSKNSLKIHLKKGKNIIIITEREKTPIKGLTINKIGRSK